jgi:hypothetical protein
MKRSIALAALMAASFFVAAAPAAAQSNKVSVTKTKAPEPASEPVKVSYAWVVTGLPGLVPNIGQGNELVEGGPRLKLDAGPPVRLRIEHRREPLDLGDDEHIPQLARDALRENSRARLANPLAENGVDDVALDIAGLPNRTVASVAYTTKAGPGTTVKAKAGAIVPGILVLGDPAQTFWRSRNLKVDVNYRF